MRESCSQHSFTIEPNGPDAILYVRTTPITPMAFAQDDQLFKPSAFHSNSRKSTPTLGASKLPKMYLPFEEGLPPAYNAYAVFDEGKLRPATSQRSCSHSLFTELAEPKLLMVKESSRYRRRGAYFVFCCCGLILLALIVAVVSHAKHGLCYRCL